MPPLKGPPIDFQDLIEQSPMLIPHTVRLFLHYSVARAGDGNLTKFQADYEEYLQETYAHLLWLHPDSIHRKRGCVDKIQTYDPSLCPPNMSVRMHFRKFIVAIVTRFLITHRTQRCRDAMERELEPLEPGTIVFMDDPTEPVLLNEIMNCLSNSVEERDGVLKIKQGKMQPLAKHFGFHDEDKRISFSNRVSRFVKYHFSEY